MVRVLLVVRDGWGYTEKILGNVVRLADTPADDGLMETRPWALLKCTGNAVGVPEGTQGGSEPGHLTMGAGRVVLQPLKTINLSIEDESFFSNTALVGTVDHCLRNRGKLHLMGLLSDQGIHGTIAHLSALLELAQRTGLDDVFIHCFLDGRDAPEIRMREALIRYYLGRMRGASDRAMMVRLLDASGIGPTTWMPDDEPDDLEEDLE